MTGTHVVKHAPCGTAIKWIDTRDRSVVFFCPACRIDVDPHESEKLYTDKFDTYDFWQPLAKLRLKQ